MAFNLKISNFVPPLTHRISWLFDPEKLPTTAVETFVGEERVRLRRCIGEVVRNMKNVKNVYKCITMYSDEEPPARGRMVEVDYLYPSFCHFIQSPRPDVICSVIAHAFPSLHYFYDTLYFLAALIHIFHAPLALLWVTVPATSSSAPTMK